MIYTIKKKLKENPNIKVFVKSENASQSQKILSILFKNEFNFYSNNIDIQLIPDVWKKIKIFFMCYDKQFEYPYKITYSCNENIIHHQSYFEFIYYEVLYKNFIKNFTENNILKENKQFVNQLFEFDF
jgi:hypothetical protein